MVAKHKEKTLHPFLRSLYSKARRTKKTIVLAEAEDDRVIQAAQQIYEQKIAQLILLGSEKKITDLKKKHKASFEFPIIDPKNYLYAFKNVEGLDLKDPHILAAVMVREGLAHAAVSGNISTTAITLRSALKVLRDKRKRAFSYFLMLGPEKEPHFFADCALNVSPDDKLLSKIAIGTAKEAKRFGVKPKIAFLSYSTHGSGHGPEADLVQRAAKMTNKVFPADELQFDAAVDNSVAKRKAPTSKVAGKANIFIFHDVMSANVGYKIAERLGGWHAIGPIVCNLKKPMNDLSRGCSVQDIVAVVAMSTLEK